MSDRPPYPPHNLLSYPVLQRGPAGTTYHHNTIIHVPLLFIGRTLTATLTFADILLTEPLASNTHLVPLAKAARERISTGGLVINETDQLT